MRRVLLVALVLSVAVLGACSRPPDPDAEKPKISASPSPTEAPEQTFELEGTVVEASGSASVTGTETQTTTRTTTPSPTGKSTSSPSPTTTTQTTTTTEISKGAPGSIAVKLLSYTSEVSGCSFKQGDTLVVAFTSTTSFDPAVLTDDKSFPNNLKSKALKISGVIIATDDGDCLLVAKSITVESPPATPTGKATTGRTASPSPTRTTSPSPTGTP